MSDIIKLDGQHIDNTPAPNKALVKQLETLLADARAGELRCMLMIGKYNCGELVDSWSGDTQPHSHEMLGMLHVTATHFAAQIAEIAVPEEVGV